MTTRTVLIVDDDKAVCRILEEFLRDDGYEPVSAGTCAGAVTVARRIEPVVALIDVNLPDGSGNGLLADLKRECPECICIMMTAYAEVDTVVVAFREGAFHYLQKPIQPEALLRLVAAAFETVRLRKAEREAQEALRESEQRFRDLAELLPLTVCEMDLDGRLTFMNRRALERSGFTEVDFKQGMSCFDLLAPGEVDRARRNIDRVLRGEDLGGIEYNVLRKDGTQAPAVIYAAPIHRQGALAGVRGVIVDITERKRAEEAQRDSETRYQTLVEAAQEGIGIVDPDENIVFVNQAYAAMLGYRKEELVGLNLSEMTSEEEFARLQAETSKRRKGEPSRYEVVLCTKTGEPRAVSVSATPLRDDKGNFAGTLGLLTDVTERRREERVLRFTQFATDNVDDAAFWMGSDARFIYVNDAACRSLGYSREELLSLTVHDIDPSLPVEAWGDHWNDLRQRGAFSFESRHRTKTGQVFPVEVSVNHLQYDGEEYNCAFVRDISERKRVGEALRESEKRQAEAEKLAATGRVVARVAHEINNPLAGIKNAFLLIKDAVPKDHPDHDLVGRIEKEIDRIARIVHQMYRLHGPDKPAISAIAVDETVRDVVLMLEPACRQYEVRIDVETEPDDLTAAIPDGSFRQVLYNLLANAIEASSPEGVIKITTTLTDKKVRVSVSDQGDGIPSEVQDRVFEPFFTTKKDTTTGGIGLGLSIVQEIVDSLRGSIEFRSTPGKGTVFEVTLPA